VKVVVPAAPELADIAIGRANQVPATRALRQPATVESSIDAAT
jgi:hypothetical protein